MNQSRPDLDPCSSCARPSDAGCELAAEAKGSGAALVCV